MYGSYNSVEVKIGKVDKMLTWLELESQEFYFSKEWFFFERNGHKLGMNKSVTQTGIIYTLIFHFENST